MSNTWAEYRESRPESYFSFTLEPLGMKDFHIKCRKLGSYTSRELADLQDKWVKARAAHLIRKIVEKAKLNESADRDEYTKEVEDILDSLDNGVTPDAQSDNSRRTAVLNALSQESSIARFQPLVGMDIECIIEWNLTDPDSGEVLKTPREDLGSLERLPVEVLWSIKEVLLQKQEEMIPPKVRKMLSL